jgi:hypothetical protein
LPALFSRSLQIHHHSINQSKFLFTLSISLIFLFFYVRRLPFPRENRGFSCVRPRHKLLVALYFFSLSTFPQTSFFFDQPSRTASWHSELTLATTETMAEYAPTGAPGAGSNGPNMNGSTDPNYAAQAPLPSSSEAAKTLW